jgi:hypothetical protein
MSFDLSGRFEEYLGVVGAKLLSQDDFAMRLRIDSITPAEEVSAPEEIGHTWTKTGASPPSIPATAAALPSSPIDTLYCTSLPFAPALLCAKDLALIMGV